MSKERGIIFNSEMVRAILDGRKKQTRRVMNNQPCTLPEETISVQQDDFNFRWAGDLHNDTSGWFTCPLGKVGDRLWVRETWSVVSHEFDDDGLMIDYVPDRPTKAVHEMPYGHGYFTGHVIYSADGDFTWGDDDGCITRHTFATRNISQGVNLFWLAGQMGHKGPEMLFRHYGSYLKEYDGNTTKQGKTINSK